MMQMSVHSNDDGVRGGRRRTGRLRGQSNGRQLGFTLVEAIMVIVITGIVGAAVAVFIRTPVRGYLDAVARAELTDTADTALNRIARDVRLALPNSVRTATDGSGNVYMELLLTRTGGRYLSVDDNPTAGNPVLDFVTAGNTTFEMVGPLPTGTQAIQAGSDSVVVYNLGTGMWPADAYGVVNATTGPNRALITAVGAGPNPIITMGANPFATQTTSGGVAVRMPSPYYHFHVISGPVTYRWDSTAKTLTRYWGYAIGETQPQSLAALSSASSALIANGVQNCAMNYTAGALMSDAIVELNLTLQASASGNTNNETVGLFMQVHVDNTP